MATLPQRLALAFKAISSRVGSLLFPGSRYRYGPGPGWSYASAARTTYALGSAEAGAYNAIVQAQFRWITDNLPEAEPRVRRRTAKGDLDPVDDHPLLELLRNPNPYYSSLSLFDATYREWRRGNAYWIIVRNAQRQPLQLWWAPSIMMEPVQGDDPTQFIAYYEYRPRSDKDAIRYAPEDVVHFRNGLNPEQPQKGMSDLDCLLRELYTDDEAAAWSSTLLANGAGPHVLISGDGDSPIGDEEGERIKYNYLQKTTGSQRGEPLVVAGRTKIQVMSFNPQEMDLKLLRRVPEERISAVIGVPAVVCGLGAGLDRSTYNNMHEAKEMATENVLLPAWRFFARELQRQLMPQFADPRRDVFDFDLSTVRALQDDQNALWKRLDDALKAGGITLNESREGRGLDTLGTPGDVYYLPVAVTPTPLAQLAPPSPGTERSEALPSPGEASADVEEEPALPQTRRAALPAVFAAKADAPYVSATHRLRERLQPPLERQLTGYLQGQQRQVLRRVRQDFKDYGEEVLDWNEEQRELQMLFDAAYRRMLDATQPLARTSLGVSFELDDPATRAYLAHAGDHIVGITETTQQAIQQALMAGQALGENLDQLTARLQSLAAFSDTRARLIARTELGTASNLATLSSFEASGVVVGVRIHDGTDHEPCAGLNGRTLSLEDAAQLPALSHPNCLVGDTVVLAPNATAAFTRHFDGEVVILHTAADDLLTCTPKHPILTDHGWVAAGELHEGDHVIRCLDSERMARWLDPDHDHVPTAIQQIADTLGPASSRTTATVPGAPEQFHGDGAYGEIHIVGADGLPEGAGNSAFRQQRSQGTVVVTDAQLEALARLRPRPQLLGRGLPPPSGRMGGSTIPGTRLGTKQLITQPMGFTRGSTHPRAAQPATDRPGVAVAQWSDLVTGQLVVNIPGSELLDSGMLPLAPAGSANPPTRLELAIETGSSDSDGRTNLLSSLAGLITPVQLVKVERRQFFGQVYNLETVQGWYIAEHILTHNCTRALAPLTRPAQLTGEKTNGHLLVAA